MSLSTAASAETLGRELMAEWIRRGGEPRVPPHRRAETVAVLTTCMVSRPVYDAYVGALQSAWNEHRRTPPLAGYRVNDDLPDVEIFRNGFSTLDDRALGEIAVVPSCVYALRMSITVPPADPELITDVGRWFFDALDEAEPGPAAPVKRAMAVDAPPSGTTPEVMAARDSTTSRFPWTRYLPPAIAACLLVAAGLTWVASRNPGNQSNAREVLLASAAQVKSEPRGVNDLAFSLEVAAERVGFVSVIILPVGKPATVHPDYGLDETRVGPGRPVSVGPFEAPVGSAAITVVTETPSTDVVRRVVDALPAGPTTAEVLTPLVRDRLFASGYRWAALGVTTVVSSKP